MVGAPAGVRGGMKNFGDWLKTEREKRGWSQAQVAENAQTSVPTVSRLETGERSPSRKLATRIAEALGVDPHEALNALIADTPGLTPPSHIPSDIAEDIAFLTSLPREDYLEQVAPVLAAIRRARERRP